MTTTLTYTKNGEQLILTLKCGPMEELVSQELTGRASFRKILEEHLAKTSGTYPGLLTLALSAAAKFDLHHTVKHEGTPPELPQDVIFD